LQGVICIWGKIRGKFFFKNLNFNYESNDQSMGIGL